MSLLPLAAEPYALVLLGDIAIFALFAVSLHFIVGPAGLHSFGHAAYFGLGAYGAAIAFKATASMSAALTAGVVTAATGALVWSVQTTDPKQPYTITGAPRVGKGKVFIGNAGAEYGVRGYVSAYDAGTGTLVWRFYTVATTGNQGANTWGDLPDRNRAGGDGRHSCRRRLCHVFAQ